MGDKIIPLNIKNSDDEFGHYFLTLVKKFQTNSPLNLSAKILPAELIDYPGLFLTTSGTSGKQKVVAHSWDNMKNRCLSKKAPASPTASFLSPQHAAGLEFFFTHYLHQVDCTMYDPAISAREALDYLQSQKTEALSLTPSTFLRFQQYPKLSAWLKENIKSISFGGEAVFNSVLTIIKKDFSHVECRSVLGSTETWSVSTEAGENLNWHKVIDQNVDVLSGSPKLLIRTPYLCDYMIEDDIVKKIEKDYWFTNDEVEWNDKGEFRIVGTYNLKYRGHRIFPADWESLLEKKFSLDWVQIIMMDDVNNQIRLEGVIPVGQEDLLPAIKKECLSQHWPIFHWSAGEFRQTERGKKMRFLWK